eukprot:scaffold7970_cov125-Isochrysis_galbana.AAC.2
MRDRSQAERPAAAMAKCARTSTRSTGQTADLAAARQQEGGQGRLISPIYLVGHTRTRGTWHVARGWTRGHVDGGQTPDARGRLGAPPSPGHLPTTYLPPAHPTAPLRKRRAIWYRVDPVACGVFFSFFATKRQSPVPSWCGGPILIASGGRIAGCCARSHCRGALSDGGNGCADAEHKLARCPLDAPDQGHCPGRAPARHSRGDAVAPGD